MPAVTVITVFEEVVVVAAVTSTVSEAVLPAESVTVTMQVSGASEAAVNSPLDEIVESQPVTENEYGGVPPEGERVRVPPAVTVAT